MEKKRVFVFSFRCAFVAKDEAEKSERRKLFFFLFNLDLLERRKGISLSLSPTLSLSLYYTLSLSLSLSASEYLPGRGGGGDPPLVRGQDVHGRPRDPPRPRSAAAAPAAGAKPPLQVPQRRDQLDATVDSRLREPQRREPRPQAPSGVNDVESPHPPPRAPPVPRRERRVELREEVRVEREGRHGGRGAEEDDDKVPRAAPLLFPFPLGGALMLLLLRLLRLRMLRLRLLLLLLLLPLLGVAAAAAAALRDRPSAPPTSSSSSVVPFFFFYFVVVIVVVGVVVVVVAASAEHLVGNQDRVQQRLPARDRARAEVRRHDDDDGDVVALRIFFPLFAPASAAAGPPPRFRIHVREPHGGNFAQGRGVRAGDFPRAEVPGQASG